MKIAWVSPFPPQKSGIANYSYWLVKALGRHAEIELYYEDGQSVPQLLDCRAWPLSLLTENHSRYDQVIYHLGNEADFHRRIYEFAWNLPGTIVLHDYNLSGFMYEAFYRSGNPLYEKALIEGYGDEGRNELQNIRRRHATDSLRFPMSHALVNRSKAVVVHHRWVKNQFPVKDHIKVIPHFAKLNYQPSGTDLENFREQFAIKPNHFVVSCLGFINTNKLPLLQIQVIQRLLNEGYPVQMLFAGAPDKSVEKLAIEITRGKDVGNFIFTGYLDERDYFSAIDLSDVVINLRNPSMGEASGTLMHSLAAAKPTIVSDVNQYKEFPDQVCWKLSHDENGSELLYMYLKRLLSDVGLRSAISANAARYVDEVLSYDKMSALWLRTILKG